MHLKYIDLIDRNNKHLKNDDPISWNEIKENHINFSSVFFYPSESLIENICWNKIKENHSYMERSGRRRRKKRRKRSSLKMWGIVAESIEIICRRFKISIIPRPCHFFEFLEFTEFSLVNTKFQVWVKGLGVHPKFLQICLFSLSKMSEKGAISRNFRISLPITT